MCVCSNLWRVKSLGERESSGFSRHHILLPPQIGQLDLPRFYFTIRQINWIRVKSRQQTHEASNFGFNFWPCNHSGELAKQSNFLNSPSKNFIWISYKDVAVVAQKSGQNLTLKKSWKKNREPMCLCRVWCKNVRKDSNIKVDTNHHSFVRNCYDGNPYPCRSLTHTKCKTKEFWQTTTTSGCFTCPSTICNPFVLLGDQLEMD